MRGCSLSYYCFLGILCLWRDGGIVVRLGDVMVSIVSCFVRNMGFVGLVELIR